MGRLPEPLESENFPFPLHKERKEKKGLSANSSEKKGRS